MNVNVHLSVGNNAGNFGQRGGQGARRPQIGGGGHPPPHKHEGKEKPPKPEGGDRPPSPRPGENGESSSEQSE